MRDANPPLGSWLLLSLGLACGSPPPPGGDANPRLDSGPRSQADNPCPQGAYYESVAGWLSNEWGAPLADGRAQLCVREATEPGLHCLSSVASGDDGSFRIDVPAAVRCAERATLRAVVPGTDTTTSYCPVAANSADGRVVMTEPTVIFATRRGQAPPTDGDLGATRSVTFDDGLLLQAVPRRLFGGYATYAALAARRLPSQHAGLCFIGAAAPESAPIEMLYGFSPESDILGEDFAVRIPNSLTLPAGSTVTLFVLGGLACTLADGTAVEEGRWQPYATATVNAAGDAIEAGATIPCLTWLGYGRD